MRQIEDYLSLLLLLFLLLSNVRHATANKTGIIVDGQEHSGQASHKLA